MVDFRKFNKLGVQILGISNDTTFAQQTFSNSLRLKFPLLSDSPKSRVTALYTVGGFWKAGTKLPMVGGRGGTLKRDRILADQAFFLVDKKGILRGRWLPGNEEAFPSKKILDTVRRVPIRCLAHIMGAPLL